MSTEQMAGQAGSTPAAPAYQYPQPRLRIQATYRAASVGEVVPAGQPESVDIEINEPYGQGRDAVAFLAGLLDSLFWGRQEKYDFTFTPSVGTATALTVAEVSS